MARNINRYESENGTIADNGPNNQHLMLKVTNTVEHNNILNNIYIGVDAEDNAICVIDENQPQKASISVCQKSFCPHVNYRGVKESMHQLDR
eukprot:894826-Amphidinium_carterae.1